MVLRVIGTNCRIRLVLEFDLRAHYQVGVEPCVRFPGYFSQAMSWVLRPAMLLLLEM